MNAYAGIFLVWRVAIKKNNFIPWYSIKFHPWNTSLTLYTHLGQPHLPPTTSTIISSNSQICISRPVKLLACSSRYICPAAHFISPTVMQVSQPLHVKKKKKSNSYYRHILQRGGGGRRKRSSIPVFFLYAKNLGVFLTRLLPPTSR